MQVLNVGTKTRHFMKLLITFRAGKLTRAPKLADMGCIAHLSYWLRTEGAGYSISGIIW